MAAAAPVPFRTVDVSAFGYGTIAKDPQARLYVVPIQPPVVIQTPPLQTATPLEEGVPFVYVNPRGTFAEFLRATEEAVLGTCLARKATWFANSFDDDALRRGFKSFFKDDGSYKLKVDPATVPCFDAAGAPTGTDAVPAGATVRCVLELARVCFGRHEFGITWRIVQLRLVETTCLIAGDPEPPAPEDDAVTMADLDSDANEFL
jgi:hypothetical protein